MALFQPSLYGRDPVFTNLFRLLDDFESYSRGVQDDTSHIRGHGRHARQPLFSPKFDVRETDNTYELDGELPGIDRKDIVIEFTEPQTLVVRGRTEHTHSSGTLPTELIEGTQTSGAITEGGEDASHKEKGRKSGTETPTDANKENKSPQATERFWHQERSIGEFHRTFTFPASIDDSSVSANLDNGILHITIPKAGKRENRRITVN